jgi:hypothetical protein
MVYLYTRQSELSIGFFRVKDIQDLPTLNGDIEEFALSESGTIIFRRAGLERALKKRP